MQFYWNQKRIFSGAMGRMILPEVSRARPKQNFWRSDCCSKKNMWQMEGLQQQRWAQKAAKKLGH
jgi:hypothetical protein